jgi:phage I-like protein
MKSRFVTMRTALQNGALQADSLPTRLKILNWGVNPTTNGQVLVNEHTAAVFGAVMKRMGLDKVPIDFEHNTAPGSPEFLATKEPRDVAAYGTPKLIPGDGLYLEDIVWTPIGREKAKNYIDLSPAVKLSDKNEVEALHSVALTRAGAVEGLTFYAADSSARDAYLNPDGTFKNGFEGCVAYMQEVEGHDEESARKICAAIGRDAGKIATATMNELLVKLAAALGEKVEPDKAEAAVIARFTALNAQIAELSKKLADAEKRIAEERQSAESRERESLIARFTAEGRVPRKEDGKPFSTEELQKLDTAALRLLLANTPVTVPLSARQTTTVNSAIKELKGLERAIAIHKLEYELQHAQR